MHLLSIVPVGLVCVVDMIACLLVSGDLDCRMGLHTGPVTAGLLRGERMCTLSTLREHKS